MPVAACRRGLPFRQHGEVRRRQHAAGGQAGEVQARRVRAGGEDFKHAVKVKLTFTNGTKKTFDPTLTTGNITSGDREGDSIFQDGLDAPDNKILPGRKITWWMGYGVDNPKDLTLDVSVGFLDYDDVIFTNSKSAP